MNFGNHTVRTSNTYAYSTMNIKIKLHSVSTQLLQTRKMNDELAKINDAQNYFPQHTHNHKTTKNKRKMCAHVMHSSTVSYIHKTTKNYNLRNNSEELKFFEKIKLYTNFKENIRFAIDSESELGHTKMSFTGAYQGRAEECHQYGGGNQSHLDREWLLSYDPKRK